MSKISRFMKHKYLYGIIALMLIIGILYYIKDHTMDYGHRVVVCVPVYGQSLALGEEAVRITNFDSLRINNNGRIVNENLDYQFGCYSDKKWKRIIKRLLHDHRHSYELSLYSMAESLVKELGEDTVICIFPGGMGETPIFKLVKDYNYLYPIFLSDIRNAYEKAKEKGWDFYVPAVCWMQGESDIIDYMKDDYKVMLKKICTDLNKDIKAITHQNKDIHLICYQANALTKAERFNAYDFNCIETRVAQATLELIRDDSLFWASGPTYSYNFVNEKIHIDALGQQQIGKLDAISILHLLRGGAKTYGLIPTQVHSEQDDVIISFSIPQPPLVFDTISVRPVSHYGFNVISKDGNDIVTSATIEDNTVRLKCKESPLGCKIRYAVNGERMKSGNKHGPRGNLRDSHPLRNWCYQFDLLLQ